MRKSIRSHYHWIIASVALVQLLIYGGAVNNFTSYHKDVVSQSLGISTTMFSLAGSFRGVVGVFSTLMTGSLIQRIGYRKTAAIGLVSAALAYVLLANMTSFWMLTAGCGLIGLASGICATSGVSRLVNLWFHRYRGTVLGIVSAATGVGSTLLSLFQSYAIDNVSWRLSFAFVAAMLAVSALIVYLFVRNTPEEMGLKPLGWGETIQGKKKAPQWAGFTMDYLKKRPSYYLLAGCALMSVFAVIATSYNFVPYFTQDCGMTHTEANRIYGTMMLVLGGVKLLTGVLCDLFTTKRMIVVCHLACALGLMLVVALPKSYFAMVAALILYDFCMPMTTLIFPLLSMELFGYQAQNQYIGGIMAMTSAASIVSGPVSSAIYDHAGSYVPVFVTSVVISIAMIPIYFLLYGMVKQDRKHLEAQKTA